MNLKEKSYISLTTIFVALIILGNLVYQKIVILKFPFYQFELSVGAILYPLTFLITDLITEIYGKDRAKFCVSLGINVNIFVALIILFMDYLPSVSWSKIDNELFHKVFGFYGVAFMGSLIACYISQVTDIYLYTTIKQITKGRFIWLRSNISTSISLLIDTAFVIGFLSIFGIFPSEQILPLILNSYSWKIFFTVCSTPVLYCLYYFIKKL